MEKVYKLLGLLTKAFPVKEGQRHSFHLRSDAEPGLELYLIVDDGARWQSILLDESDFEKDVDSILSEIELFIATRDF